MTTKGPDLSNVRDYTGEHEFRTKIRGEWWTFKFTSPDNVNEAGRDAGLPVQAKALTLRAKYLVLISWPPTEAELGMTFEHLMSSLIYEVVSNVCLLDNDPKGR